MTTLERSKWIDVGNGERSAIIADPAQPGNYKSLRVRPWPNGEFFYYVNEFFRGRAATMAAAKKSATEFAVSQLSG